VGSKDMATVNAYSQGKSGGENYTDCVGNYDKVTMTSVCRRSRWPAPTACTGYSSPPRTTGTIQRIHVLGI
jgi:hypothetical protein